MKYYPAGATTNSDTGVTALDRVYPVLAAMEKQGVVLSLHGEVTAPDVDMFDRERVFVETLLPRIVRDFPGLKVVLEHITTREAATFVREQRAQPRRHDHAATSALLAQRAVRRQLSAAALFLPARPEARGASARADCRSHVRRSAFLPRHGLRAARKTHEGKRLRVRRLLSAHAALPMYAEAFEDAGALDRLAGFASRFGAQFYGLPPHEDTVTLTREAWTVPAEYAFGASTVVPLRAGEVLRWRVA